MDFIRHLASIFVGLGSGFVVSGAVFAFITVLGVVPRFAQKTGTKQYVRVYESAIVAGGIFGTVAGVVEFSIPLGLWWLLLLGLGNGIFFGTLAMSLAEVLNVIPILTRRVRVQQGMFILILVIAAGKTIGSLLYFLVTGFYDPGNV